MNIKKPFIIILLLSISTHALALKPAPWIGNALDGTPCSGEPGYGPYDYIKNKDQRHLVESYHFTPEVESLVSGHSGSLEQDLNYTLRAFPNHHKALLSVIRYKLDLIKGIKKGKLQTQPECYLIRAIKYNPEDSAVYSLYAFYLSKLGDNEKARELYSDAIKIDPDNMKIKYSFALFLLDNNEKSEANKLAQEIYHKQKNAPSGLRKQLNKVGAWEE
jgi:tetratricopeptide (TPR) repeat protein